MSSVERAADRDVSSTPAERLARLGLVLPPAPSPIANFVTHVQHGDLLFLSGQGPRDVDGVLRTGKVGDDISTDEAYAHARLTGLNLLAVMELALGDLRRVGRVVKLFGMVNATTNFSDHPKVINGCSDLFVAVFGEGGQHARSAIGVGSLPGHITVEIEAIISIKSIA